jgi:ABC-type phosphate transport system substrate-binding protein
LSTLSVGAAAQVTYVNQFTGLGSSALFLELGKAAVSRAKATLPAGYSVCSWSTKDSNSVLSNRIYANDQAPALANTGNFWAVWTQKATCPNVPTAGTVTIWSYIQEDSAVGNRCLLRTGTTAQECVLVVPTPASGTVTDVGGANLISGQTDITIPLPVGVVGALNGVQFGVAGSDVRPEDSQFQIYRALQATTTTIPSSSNGGAVYPGLGLASGSSTCETIAVKGDVYDGGEGSGGLGTFGNPGSVTAAEFALPGGTDPCTGAAAVTVMNVIPVAATPVVVAVNTTDASGFGNTTNVISNVNRGELAAFLDGDLCRPADLFPQDAATTSVYSTTLIREPFSGTYTTMEYNVPASRGIQGSQEGGVTAPQTQPTVFPTCKGKGGARSRVTSTGNMVYAIQNVPDALGYFFWSTANGSNFTSSGGVPTNAKYLTVDGIDPLLTTYFNGCVPIAANASGHCSLTSVTFAHIKDGSYPIWSVQRLVTTCVATATGCQQNEALAMTTAAQKAVTSTLPDFVPATAANLHVFHAHYLPSAPSTVLQGHLVVANGNCGDVESGGDVGGIVLNVQSDIDYCADFAVKTGLIELNRLVSGTHNGNPGMRQ